jgi:hypothetical protein
LTTGINLLVYYFSWLNYKAKYWYLPPNSPSKTAFRACVFQHGNKVRANYELTVYYRFNKQNYKFIIKMLHGVLQNTQFFFWRWQFWYHKNSSWQHRDWLDTNQILNLNGYYLIRVFFFLFCSGLSCDNGKWENSELKIYSTKKLRCGQDHPITFEKKKNGKANEAFKCKCKFWAKQNFKDKIKFSFLSFDEKTEEKNI